MRAETNKEEEHMASVDSTYHPVFPDAPYILDWVKYTYPDEYLKMLDGEEIGFQKYYGLYKDSGNEKEW